MSGGSAAGRYIGQSVQRTEDPRLLTGHGTFVDDVVVPGMFHAHFVRSDVARGRITRLDVEAARQFPGVYAVLTAAEVNGDIGTMQPTMFTEAGFGPNVPSAPLHPLADTDVRFVGDPIALIIAENRYVAEDAAELVEVDIDLLTPVVDYELAADETGDIVHEELGSNIAMRLELPRDPAIDEAIAGAAHVVTETFHQHRHTCVPMETRGIVARWEPFANELHVWMATQAPHEVRLVCSRVLGIPENHIRVTARDVGGGFGQKMFMPREEIVVALAAHRLGIAVKWIEDRRENLVAANHARVDRAVATVAVDADGGILAAWLDHLEDAGSFPVGATGGAGAMVGMAFPGPYRVPKYGFSTTAVWTNTMGRGAYRGPWMFETVAREQMWDHVARTIGMDPLEFRRHNVIEESAFPYTNAVGMMVDNVTPGRTLELAAEMIGYDAVRAAQAVPRTDGKLLGIGMALTVEPTATGIGALGVEVATVRIEPTGQVHVLLGTGAHGQGIETTMAQVVAEHLGVDFTDVVVMQGDTDVAPFGGGTGGSRTAVTAGAAARGAAELARDKVLAVAAHLMEAAPEDLEINAGVVAVKGTPTRSISMLDVATAAYHKHEQLPEGMEPGLEATFRYKAPGRTWANACHACTVEVDTTTGKVEILRYIVSEDCGVMINPMVVEGQVSGGVVQGIGAVLYEHLVYDPDGNPLSTTFLDYLLPTAAEVPIIEFGHVETPSNTPGGHKGVGEGGAIVSPPTVFNAVADALAQIGVKITKQPLGPNEIVAAIAAAELAGADA